MRVKTMTLTGVTIRIQSVRFCLSAVVVAEDLHRLVRWFTGPLSVIECCTGGTHMSPSEPFQPPFRQI